MISVSFLFPCETDSEVAALTSYKPSTYIPVRPRSVSPIVTRSSFLDRYGYYWPYTSAYYARLAAERVSFSLIFLTSSLHHGLTMYVRTLYVHDRPTKMALVLIHLYNFLQCSMMCIYIIHARFYEFMHSLHMLCEPDK